MKSKPIKFTEVKDKRLLKATPMEREKLIFVDNSYMSVVLEKAYNEIAVFVSDIREVKHAVIGRRQTAKIASDFEFFSFVRK